jgi:hypothetical protein
MLVPIQFHLLPFEGPDAYARAGGIATRVSGLAQALAEADFDTHLWFIGDPALPGHETQESLHLHRWFQWISRYHPASVYDGEEGKRLDYYYSGNNMIMQPRPLRVPLDAYNGNIGRHSGAADATATRPGCGGPLGARPALTATTAAAARARSTGGEATPGLERRQGARPLGRWPTFF